MNEPRQQSKSLEVQGNARNKLSFQLKHQNTQDEKQLMDSAAMDRNSGNNPARV